MNASEIHKQALSILEQFFGYSSFREGQLDIIQSVCNHTDTLVVIPTGGGRTISYSTIGIKWTIKIIVYISRTPSKSTVYGVFVSCCNIPYCN